MQERRYVGIETCVIAMKGIVTVGEGIYMLRSVVLWNGLIKSYTRRTAQHLFTEDFSLPDSAFLLPVTPFPYPRPLPHFLCHLCVASLCLSESQLSTDQQLQVIRRGRSAAKAPLFSSAQIHLFYHHSFMSIYIGPRERNSWSIWAMLCVIS